MPEPQSPQPALPPDAPKGAVCQLDGGIWVDERGQEVRPPKMKAEAEPEAEVSPQLEAYLAPKGLDAALPSHEG